jgi:hypothetical protein
VSEPDRRRHERSRGAALALDLVVGAELVGGARLVDVSRGGLLVELPMGASPPALHARARATLKRDGVVVERPVRVVRIRWAGRASGASLPPALALVFDDPDSAAAASFASMIAGAAGGGGNSPSA